MALIKCPECEKEISDKSLSCIYCGCPINQESPIYDSEKTNSTLGKLSSSVTILLEKFKNSKNLKIAIAIVTIVLILIIGITTFSTEPTLKRCEKLLGASVEEVLSDKEFTVTESSGIKLAKSPTKELFNISGEIQIFIESSEDSIEIVTWKNDYKTELISTDIEYFINKMIKAYGTPLNSSNDSYLWDNNRYSVFLKIDGDVINIMWVNTD